MGLRDVENIEVPGQGLRRVEILPLKTAVGFSGMKWFQDYDSITIAIYISDVKMYLTEYICFFLKVQSEMVYGARLPAIKHITRWARVSLFVMLLVGAAKSSWQVILIPLDAWL